jgi:sRNA-binding carbon storage regulator CsrA
MLRLKRKQGQTVLIGGSVELTVLALEAGLVRVQLTQANASRSHSLQVGEGLQVHVRGGEVRVNLDGVDRGEALLSFDAPRSISIERPERLGA